MSVVSRALPRVADAALRVDIGESLVWGLAAEQRDQGLTHIQPASVLGRAVKRDLLGDATRLVGGNASQRLAGPCVFRLSSTTRIVFAHGK